MLHSVNPLAGSQRVYRRNSRCRTLLHTAHFGDVVEMEVGALLVGRICNHTESAGASFEKTYSARSQCLTDPLARAHLALLSLIHI